jgi:hypothetical protein
MQAGPRRMYRQIPIDLGQNTMSHHGSSGTAIQHIVYTVKSWRSRSHEAGSTYEPSGVGQLDTLL